LPARFNKIDNSITPPLQAAQRFKCRECRSRIGEVAQALGERERILQGKCGALPNVRPDGVRCRRSSRPRRGASAAALSD
jgi:hypothetical protein